MADQDHDVPKSIGVGIALTTDPQVTRGLLESWCLALTDATGIAVVPRGVSSYARLLEQLHQSDEAEDSEVSVDVVWLPPILALRATANDHVVPIALPIRNGESSYWAALFARDDSRHRTIADLERLRAAWVDPQSAAGYLIIRAQLAEDGVDLGKAFAQNTFFGSHAAVAKAVLDGKADVGATYAYLDAEGRARRAGWGSHPMRMIAHAGPIPNDIIAARKGLPSILVRVVQSALVDAHNVKVREAARVLLNAEGFAVPSPEHLTPLRHLLRGLQEAGNEPHSMFPPPLQS